MVTTNSGIAPRSENPEIQHYSNTRSIQAFLASCQFYYDNIYWPHFTLLVGGPLLECLKIKYFGAHTNPKTLWLALILSFMYGIGVTAGYHRLWAHRAYQASLPLRYFLAVLGCGNVQRPIIWWVRHHRAHHRYVDTEKDPYNIRRGFFYAHMGWLISYNPSTWGQVDVSDVESDPVARWQQRYYPILLPLVSTIVPASIAYFGWGDLTGGFWVAGLFRLLVNAHMIFCVNSVAHAFGRQTYTTSISARDNTLLALLTAGEGYHNFHHRFPSDFRNAPHWTLFDISKYFISMCEKVGLAGQLIRTSDEEIKRIRKQTETEKWEAPIDQQHNLPLMTRDDFCEKSRTGRCLFIISGRVCDVTDFVHRHPGGPEILQNCIGTDATALFISAGHPTYAWEIVDSLQIAIAEPSM